MDGSKLAHCVAVLGAWGWTALLLLMLFMPVGGGPSIPYMDKVVHLGLFGGFGTFWTWAGAPVRRTAWVGVVLAPLTELVQGVLPWPRGTDPADAATDVVGLALGLAFGFWTLRLKKKRRPQGDGAEAL